MTRLRSLLVCVGLGLAGTAPTPVTAADDSWPGFRGPNSTGVVAADARPLPTKLGPDQALVWKCPLPPGHSSPVVVGDRIYLTGVRGDALVTFAIDRATGAVVWQAEAPRRFPEKIHATGSHAQASNAADGDVVVSLFGESGLLAYDRAGKLLWDRPTGPVKNDFGVGSSPVLVGDRLIVNQDHDADSALLVLDKKTGRLIWKADRGDFWRGYSTPVVWETGGAKQVVVAGTLRVVGYDFETGKELWTVRGLSRIVNTTPVVGPDGTLYVSAWSPGGEADDRIAVPTWDELLAGDKNANGTLEPDELPEGPVKQRFTQIDLDKDGHVTRAELERFRDLTSRTRNRLVAIKPGGAGDVTETHVLWSQTKHLPYCPSPLLYRGTLFMVKDGGMVTSLDPGTGKVLKQDRVGGGSRYYSSPVGGDGKVYLLSERGQLTVISAEPKWRELSNTRFGEEGHATPAIVDGRIYLRTAAALYCFGLPEGNTGEKTGSR